MTPKQIYSLVKTFGTNYPEFAAEMAHAEFFYRLEPYVVKFMEQMAADEMLKISAIYLRAAEQGARPFLETLVALNSVKIGPQASVARIMEYLAALKVEEMEQLELNISASVQEMCQHVLRNINSLNARHDLVPLLVQMQAFRIGNRTLSELLAVEFSKHIDSFDLDQKVKALYALARADVEASNIFQILHAVAASHFEAQAILIRNNQDPLT